MKKLIIIMFVCLLLPACSNNKEEENVENKIEEKIDISVNTVDNINPIKVGLYQYDKLVKKYQTTLANHKDIAVFNIYYTNTESLDSSNIKYNWNKYYSQYNDIDNYKIGFYISFQVKDKKIEKLILDPRAQHSMDPYLYIYLYDDIHQIDGSWYSHLEQDDIKEDTIFSSIKLYFAGKGSEITSPISLTVFTYDEDDIDEEGHYKGTSKYSVTIETN